jgi:O-methyltransferase
VDNVVITKLAEDNEDMSDVDRLVNIYWALVQVLYFGVPGAVVELGCNAGKTSVFLQMIIDETCSGRELHLYDSFQGLPRPGQNDAYLAEGDCTATTDQLRASFARWSLREPLVHEGWFQQTLPEHLPDEICFAYLDGDFYDSIKISLKHVWPRVSPGGLILIDDYADTSKNPAAWDGLPGVRTAVDEYFSTDPAEPFVLVGTGDLAMAGVRKPLDDPAMWSRRTA